MCLWGEGHLDVGSVGWGSVKSSGGGSPGHYGAQDGEPMPFSCVMSTGEALFAAIPEEPSRTPSVLKTALYCAACRWIHC